MTDNIPAALANAPIPLLGDERCQMSFGERAALEGVLSQLRPSVALEIGSAYGGSLARIARHSHRVHAFDLAPPRLHWKNVTLHAGESRFTLPDFLAAHAEFNRTVDFALIDGDHEVEAVRADVHALLESPTTQGTVILLHDTAHPNVREALRDVAEMPKVVYLELDFVPGYTFARGNFAGQQWGGLGLLVTGDRSTDGYGSSPRQTLYS